VLLLDITAKIGPSVRPATLEALVRGVRVAVDVARDADTRRIRRIAQDQMRFPTDTELRDAIERFPSGSELGPRYRAQRQLEARERLREEVLHGPPEFWFDWFYRRGRQPPGKLDVSLREAGYERLLSTAPIPIFPGAVGLDALDPALYQALVSETVARLMPGEVRVGQLRYENPFLERLLGKATAEHTISTAAQVIETVSTLGSTRKMAKAAADVAERTVEHRVEDSELDLELKRLQVQREHEALLADRIANAQAAEKLVGDRRQQAIIDAALRRGLLDVADTIEDLDVDDAAALGELGRQPVELEQHYERDDDEHPSESETG
jgi:hypothetical protein